MQTTSNDQRNKSDSDRLILYKDLREARQKKISRRRRRTVAVIVAFILLLLIYLNWA